MTGRREVEKLREARGATVRARRIMVISTSGCASGTDDYIVGDDSRGGSRWCGVMVEEWRWGVEVQY